MAYFRKRMYGRRPARKGTKKTTRKAVKKAVRSVKDARIKAVVKKVLGRQVETKIKQDAGSFTCRTIQNAQTSTQFDAQVFMMTPQGALQGSITQAYPIIGNGIGQDQRIGDEVKVKGHYIKYICNALPYSATTNPSPKPQIVQVYVVQPKTGQRLGLQASNIQATNVANWFENQTDVESGMAGTLYDKLRKVDSDNYRIIAYREHKIGFNGALNTSNAVATLQNNDFKQFVSGSIRVKGYNLKFDRLEYPQRIPMYLFVQVVAADGSLNGTSVIPVDFRFNHTIYYSDM